MSRLAAALLTGAALGGLPGAASAQTTVLADGHVDYAARMVAGQLRSQIKDGTRGADQVVWRDPASVVFRVARAARTVVPDDPRMAFLGPPGSATWMIPQVQRAGILWAGWNTEELTPADVSGSIAWTLQAVQGPGTLAVFQTGSFGDPDVIFDSADGLPDQRQIATGVHAHANWAFSRPGSYQLTFGMSARRPSGEAVADTQTLNVVVEADGGGASPPAPSDGSSPSPSTAAPGTATGNGQAPATSTAPGAGATAKTTLSASRARVRGRTLSFRMRLGRTSRLDVAVKRGGRVVTRATTRTVAGSARQRTLRVRLGRRLRAGWTYRATIRARAGGTTVAKTLTLRAPRKRAAASAAAAKVVLDDGHVDAGSARIVHGKLRAYVKDATGGDGKVVWRDPASVVIRVVDEARVTLPPGMGFIGRAGQTVWMIPQVQKPGVIWAGWNTEEISSRQIRGGIVWKLIGVAGPGRVVLFQTGSFGDEDVLFDGARRLPQRYTIPPGTHAHGNWAFTKRGTYALRFAMSVTTRAGKRLSDAATLTYRVG